MTSIAYAVTEWGDAGLATLLSAVIAGFVAWATARTSSKAHVDSTMVSTRADTEREAFERAKGFYTDTIDRQSVEIHEVDEAVAILKSVVRDLEDRTAKKRRMLQIQMEEIASLRVELEQMRQELERCRRESERVDGQPDLEAD